MPRTLDCRCGQTSDSRVLHAEAQLCGDPESGLLLNLWRFPELVVTVANAFLRNKLADSLVAHQGAASIRHLM